MKDIMLDCVPKFELQCDHDYVMMFPFKGESDFYIFIYTSPKRQPMPRYL